MGAFPQSPGYGGDRPWPGSPDRYSYEEPEPRPKQETAPAPETGFIPPAQDPSIWGGGEFGYWTLAEMGTEQALEARKTGEYARELDKLTAPALKGYATFLEQMTDPDSAARMAAAGPGVAAITRQQEAARRNIEAALPRSGAKDYLTSLSYIQQAGDIGALIDQAWLQAEQARGEFGEWGVSAAQRGLMLEQAGLGAAAGTTLQAVNLKQGIQAQNQESVMQAIQIAAMIAASVCQVASELYGFNDARTWKIRIYLLGRSSESRAIWFLVRQYARRGRWLTSMVRRGRAARWIASKIFARLFERARNYSVL